MDTLAKPLKMGLNCPKRKPDRLPSIILPHGRSLLNFRGVLSGKWTWHPKSNRRLSSQRFWEVLLVSFWNGTNRCELTFGGEGWTHQLFFEWRCLYGCFRKYWYPQIIHSNTVFHSKPSILGYPYFWKHPYFPSYLNGAVPSDEQWSEIRNKCGGLQQQMLNDPQSRTSFWNHLGHEISCLLVPVGVLKVSAWVVMSWVHFDRTCRVILSHLRWDIRYPGSSFLICYKHVIFNV